MIDRVRLAARPSTGRSTAKAAAPDSEEERVAQDQITLQRTAFDADAAERAELLREADVLRDMMLQQLKNDDEALKKYIALI